MYVHHLRIKNFRNFGEPPFLIELQPFTLILGENNIGKTNLLAAISLLFSQEISVIQRRNLEIDDINFQAVAAFKQHVADQSIEAEDIIFPEVEIHATLGDIQEGQHPVVGDWYSNEEMTEASVTYRFSVRGNFKRDKWIKEQREAITYRKKKDGEQKSESGDGADNVDYSLYVDFPIEEYRHTLFGGGRPSNECEAWLLRMLRAEILDALRDAERELVAGGEQRLLFRVLRQSSEARYTDVKRLLEDLKIAIDTDPSLNAIKTEVQELLALVSLDTPGEDHTIGLQFAAPEAAEILKKIGMTYGVNPITVARNGLGRNNLLYVALVLSQMAKAPDIKPGDDSYICFRVVGIEEPEAHLHPHLQDHLARNIEDIRGKHSDSLQLVLTSHSTHIAAKLSLQNTAVLFHRESDGAIAAHYVLDGIDPAKDKDAVRFLSLYLDATKSRMFFARRLILVEGISEQIVIPILFEDESHKQLESLGCTVINVNGLAFQHFLTIIKNGFFKKCVVLTDRDIGTKSENRAELLKEKFKDVSHINIQVTTESTFEKELISANRAGVQKELLFDALALTKPINGPKLKTETGANDISVDTFFLEIEKYKAEFAFNLVSVIKGERLAAEKEGRSPRKLSIPTYISQALDFIKE
ncbi:MAG: ATP-dependent endonuclease [Nitrospirales bacterium]|nr:MAG: ATP-dependent endonuclease [Nitrospirales bacterium]